MRQRVAPREPIPVLRVNHAHCAADPAVALRYTSTHQLQRQGHALTASSSRTFSADYRVHPITLCAVPSPAAKAAGKAPVRAANVTNAVHTGTLTARHPGI